MGKQQKSPWQRLLYGLVLGGAGALLGYLGGIFLKTYLPAHLLSPQSKGEAGLLIFLALFAIWCVIAFHELGHLLAGLVQGFRMALYTAGLLGARGTENGVQFFFNRQFNLMGGLAATFPERLESGPDLRRKFVRIVASGPLASLLLSLLAWLGFFLVLQNTGTGTTLATRAALIFLLFTGAVSGVIFLITMIPTQSGGFMSDGARLMSLLSGGEKSRYEEASLSFTALMGAGKLPGEYPTDMLERLLTRTPDSMLGLNGHYVAFTHYLDRMEVEKASPLARIVLDNISAVPKAFQAYYLKEIVFFYAFVVWNADEAFACWSETQKQAERNPDAALYRTKAALALLDGEVAEAEAFAQKGLEKISDLPFAGQRRFEEKWLKMILKKVDEG